MLAIVILVHASLTHPLDSLLQPQHRACEIIDERPLLPSAPLRHLGCRRRKTASKANAPPVSLSPVTPGKKFMPGVVAFLDRSEMTRVDHQENYNCFNEPFAFRHVEAYTETCCHACHACCTDRGNLRSSDGAPTAPNGVVLHGCPHV